MKSKKIELSIPVPSQGLSPGDVARFGALIHEVLATIADKLEAATDWDCEPSVRIALAAGLRGDRDIPRFS